jgi:hypothetical protein
MRAYVLIVVMMVAAACGKGDDKASPAADPGAAKPTAAPAAPPVPVTGALTYERLEQGKSSVKPFR